MENTEKDLDTEKLEAQPLKGKEGNAEATAEEKPEILEENLEGEEEEVKPKRPFLSLKVKKILIAVGGAGITVFQLIGMIQFITAFFGLTV